MRKILFIIGVILFAFIGCAENKEIKVPNLNVTCNEKEIEVQKGGYSWTRKVGLFDSESIIADAASPEQIASEIDGDNITGVSELKLEFDREPEDFEVNYIDIYGDTKEVKYRVEDDSIVLLNDVGTYIFEIIGKWEEGQSSYIIKIVTEI